MSAIHIHHDEDGRYEVWLNCEPGEHFVGLCLGSANTKQRALFEALKDLVSVTEDMRRELNAEMFRQLVGK